LNPHLQALLQVLISYWASQPQDKALPLTVNLIGDAVQKLIQDMSPQERQRFLALLISTLRGMAD